MQSEKFSINTHHVTFKGMGDEVELVPFGDIHHGSPLFATDRWKEFLDREKSDLERGVRKVYLGMGDYLDLLSTSERIKFRNSNLHESTDETFEDLFYGKCDDFIKDISFMKGKIVGMLEGNHHLQFMNGTTSTQYFCKALQTRYFGVSSFIRIYCKVGNTRRRTSFDIWAHHGRGGGGRRVGSSINSVQDMIDAADASVYLMGHDHRKGAMMVSRLYLAESPRNGIRLRHRKIILARTGSFLKGYEPEKRSYVARKALSPTDLGVVRIKMTPKTITHDDGSKGFHIQLNVSF